MDRGNPTAEWLARQITEAFPWDGAPKYLIRDNDRAFVPDFVQIDYSLDNREAESRILPLAAEVGPVC